MSYTNTVIGVCGSICGVHASNLLSWGLGKKEKDKGERKSHMQVKVYSYNIKSNPKMLTYCIPPESLDEIIFPTETSEKAQGHNVCL